MPGSIKQPIMINLIATILIATPSAYDSTQLSDLYRFYTIKKFNGKSWNLLAAFSNNAIWDKIVADLNSQKSYLSYGISRLDSADTNTYIIDKGNQISQPWFITNTSYESDKGTFSLFWRSPFQHIPNDPGFTKSASKEINKRINAFIENESNLQRLTDQWVDHCRVQKSANTGVQGECSKIIVLSKQVNIRNLDTTVTQTYAYVLVQKRDRLKTDWRTLVDTSNFAIQVPAGSKIRIDLKCHKIKAWTINECRMKQLYRELENNDVRILNKKDKSFVRYTTRTLIEMRHNNQHWSSLDTLYLPGGLKVPLAIRMDID